MVFKNFFILLLISAISLSGVFAQTFDKFVDSRDGKEYKTIKIGKQEWLADNLNYQSKNSWCYNKEALNCEKYGRLYSYQDAEKACPGGWRLPGENDWNVLLNYAGAESNAIELTQGGRSGFNATYAGVRYENGNFNHLGEYGYFWSRASKDEAAWVYTFSPGVPTVHRIRSFPATGFSVRCIRR